MQPVAYITTPFPDKFSIPRQPGLAPSIRAHIKLHGDYDHAASIEGIEQYSHLWLLFEFDKHRQHSWRERVRPPRLGGNKSMGVFATRSPFRPNNIGLSVVKLLEVIYKPGVELIVGGADLLDQTPIIDIKPYVPYVDSIVNAESDFAPAQPAQLQVQFSDAAEQSLAPYQLKQPELKAVICEVLSQDPRPAYHANKKPHKQYVSCLYQLELHWQVSGVQLIVNKVTRKNP